MKSYEFSRFYHPRLGRFVYKHKGNGVIVDSVLAPVKSVMGAVFKKFAKPLGKKALEAGISHSGEKLGKKISEKSGDLIMKKLSDMRGSKGPRPKGPQGGPSAPKAKETLNPAPQQESADEILNRLISGQGNKKKRKRI